jgi:hypothetical protein
MARICVATADGRAHYSIVSLLARAGVEFTTVVPGEETSDCEVVVTTRAEESSIGGKTIALESLDRDPRIVRAQIISTVAGGNEVVLMGIDPGVRTGLAGFYGSLELVSATFNSVDALLAFSVGLLGKIPRTGVIVRIGDGNPRLAESLAAKFASVLPKAKLELVDERGTSTGSHGTMRDQKAAARIALRKGRPI